MPLEPAFRQIIATFRASDAWDTELDLRLLRVLWPEIAGPAIARQTSIAAIQGHQVVIRVPDSTWQQQLYSIRTGLIRKMNEPWPDRWIRDLRFVL